MLLLAVIALFAKQENFRRKEVAESKHDSVPPFRGMRRSQEREGLTSLSKSEFEERLVRCLMLPRD